MGLCDLIPGISGGTIAFIMGIYERFVHSVKGILDVKAIFEFLAVTIMVFSFSKKGRKNFDIFYKKYDLYFLFTLAFGILLAILLGSRVIVYLLGNYFVYTMMFFIGLILASSFTINRKIRGKSNLLSRFFILFGLLVGALLVVLVPVEVEVTLPYLFFSGFVGVMAMFLPGISGSYILYVLGSYEFVLNCVTNLFTMYLYLIVFSLGMLLGMVIISRVVSFLLKNYKNRTLYFLLGFVLGALLIPIRDVLLEGFTYFEIGVGFVLLVVGVLFVYMVEKFGTD